MNEPEPPSQFGQLLLDRTRTYLIPSVISCLFCLVPGLIAVYYGFQVRAYRQIADRLTPEEIADAVVASGKARFFMILSYGVGVIGIVVQIYRNSN